MNSLGSNDLVKYGQILFIVGSLLSATYFLDSKIKQLQNLQKKNISSNLKTKSENTAKNTKVEITYENHQKEIPKEDDQKHILFVCTKCTLTKETDCFDPSKCKQTNPNQAGIDIEDLVDNPSSQMPIRNGRQLYQELAAAHNQSNSETLHLSDKLEIRPTRCLAICDDGCAIALTGPDKFSYQFGKLDHTDPDSVGDILKFAKYYVETEGDAITKKGQRPPKLRKNLFARLPPKNHFSEFIPE